MTTNFDSNRLLSNDFLSFVLRVSWQKLISAAGARAYILYSIAWISDSKRIWNNLCCILGAQTTAAANRTEYRPYPRPASSVISLESIFRRVCDFVFTYPISALSRSMICNERPSNQDAMTDIPASGHTSWIPAFRMSGLITLLPLPLALRSLCVEAAIAQSMAATNQFPSLIFKYLISTGFHFFAGFLTYSIGRLSVEFIFCNDDLVSIRTRRRQKYLTCFWEKRLGL